MKKRIGSGLLAVSLVLSLLVAISPNANAATTTIYASDVLTEARATIGGKYVRGGYKDPESGLDCSGLIYYIYHTRLGYPMTRAQTVNVNQLTELGTKITDKSKLLPGDIVEFSDISGNISHVGIYIGNNSIIHAANPSNGICRTTLENKMKDHPEWRRVFEFAIRLNGMVMDVGGGQTVTKPSQPAKPTLSVVSQNSGKWDVTIPANYKLLCYTNPADARNSTYIKAQPGAYVLPCTKSATLSNGKTRYFFVSGDKKSLWFDCDANLMSVINQEEVSQKQYTVYFDPNGGVVSQTSKTVAAGSVVGSMPTPTREGYTFLGWSTNKNTSGLLLRTGDEMVVEKDTTLYAEWKEVSKVTRVTRTSQLNIRNMETSENTAEGWSWNKETKTLTLDNVNFVVADEPSALICNEATIILTGTNTITSTYNNTKESSITCGILSRAGNLVFKGTGTLTVTGGTSKGSSHGIALTSTGGGQHMTIDGPSITAIGGTSTKFSCSGVEAYDLIISNGSLTAIGGSASDSSNGVYCKGGNLTINGGYLKATSGTSKRNQYDYDETAIQLYGEHCTISCGDNIAIKTPIGGKSSVVTVGGHPRTIVVDSSNVPAKEIVIE